MGGSQSINADTHVNKDQAITAVLDAFKDKSTGHTISIRDVASHAQGSEGPGNLGGSFASETRLQHDNGHWRTSYQVMTSRDHTPAPTSARGCTGMTIGGYTPRGGGGNSTWTKAISSGALTRDTRMVKVRHMFEAMDQDNTSDITKEEFMAVLIGEGIPQKDAVELFHSIDESHSGRITLAKFDHYVAVHTLGMVRQTFKSLDSSNDRQIQKQEFVRYFLGNGVSKRQAALIWLDMDKNSNGRINFVEYRDWAQATLQNASIDEVAINLGLSNGP
eukprot:TRINITY_DN95184_c0_g1_i1.p1 TRINITY_DN95184_c0_g1~~TRINITY_DN95184_c0_g1_i1.p1  ORF type:complete len:276 (-),score=30.61 TRINITY_DN95184_c0_g1_i1:55-882(-)